MCRVFNDKLQELLKDIKDRHIFGKVCLCANVSISSIHFQVKAYSYSIEHQKRGMPHVHMLITLEEKDAAKLHTGGSG